MQPRFTAVCAPSQNLSLDDTDEIPGTIKIRRLTVFKEKLVDHLIQEILFEEIAVTVSFQTRNLSTFLLCLIRSIISSLVNDYYLICFLFQSVSLKHLFQILYFIFHRYKLLSTPPILSAVHVWSTLGDLSTVIRS